MLACKGEEQRRCFVPRPEGPAGSRRQGFPQVQGLRGGRATHGATQALPPRHLASLPYPREPPAISPLRESAPASPTPAPPAWATASAAGCLPCPCHSSQPPSAAASGRGTAAQASCRRRRRHGSDRYLRGRWRASQGPAACCPACSRRAVQQASQPGRSAAACFPAPEPRNLNPNTGTRTGRGSDSTGTGHRRTSARTAHARGACPKP